MTKHLVIVAMAASALAFTGCNRADDADTAETGDAVSLNETTETAATPAADADAPAATETPAIDPAQATPAVEEGLTPPPADNTAAESAEVTLPGGTRYVDVEVGTGTEAVAGNRVTVHYTGTLTNGEKFDSSLDRGTPFTFTLGGNEVIGGWDEGIAGMKVGGKRKLTIPPEQGYGSDGAGPIPPNSTLLFDVELLQVQ